MWSTYEDLVWGNSNVGQVVSELLVLCHSDDGLLWSCRQVRMRNH